MTLRGERCLCRSCGECFNSGAAFDKHRVGGFNLAAPGYGRRCRTVPEMIEAGMTRNAAGFWRRGAANTWHAHLPISCRGHDQPETSPRPIRQAVTAVSQRSTEGTEHV